MKNILICGGLLIDRYMLVDRYPARGEDGYILESLDVVGGCTVNMAKTVKNLGAAPYMVSYIGDDRWGKKLSDFMISEGFPRDCVREKAGSTGYCLVFLEPDGERTFLTSIGCEAEYSDSLIAESAGNDCGVAAVTGYYLLDATSAALINRLKEFKRGGMRIVFDPSPLADKIKADHLRDILSLSDVVVPNKTEAEFIAALEGYDRPEQWALSISARGASVIITDGSAGGALYQCGTKTPYSAVNANVVDTTGAGDSFTAAIACSLLSDIPLEKAVILAASTAAVTASVKGPHGDFDISCLTVEARNIWKGYGA